MVWTGQGAGAHLPRPLQVAPGWYPEEDSLFGSVFLKSLHHGSKAGIWGYCLGERLVTQWALLHFCSLRV